MFTPSCVRSRQPKRSGLPLDRASLSFGLTSLEPGRTKVAVQHEKLPTYDSVEEWKFYWAEWLDAIDLDET